MSNSQIYARRPITMPDSLWASTAEPPVDAPPVQVDERVDVLIIGAGFTGLSTALHVAQRGREPVVVDAGQPGYGASGRNGGQVIPGLKWDPNELIAKFGEKRGAAMARFAGEAADRTFELIRCHQIRCAADQSGWLQGAHSKARLELVTRRAQQWREFAGTAVRLLDATEIARLAGTRRYVGGWIDPRGGSVQPLSYSRGLARVVQSAGGRIHGSSLAERLRRDGNSWVVTVNGHSLTARSVVIATNGYTGELWPGLRRTLLPANSVQIATTPLTPELRRSVLPGGMPLSDSRRLLVYMRIDPDGRFVIGSRGSFFQHEPQRYFDTLRRIALEFFPQLAGVSWEHQWSGTVALTIDGLPHLHRLAPELYAGLGYNGRGVALASQMGVALADLLTGTPEDQLAIPLTVPRGMPAHWMRQPAMEAVGAWYRLLDRVGL